MSTSATLPSARLDEEPPAIAPRRRAGRARGRWHGTVTSLPAFGWLCLFFLVPTSFVAVFSVGESSLFGTSPVDLSTPSLDRYREAAGETFRIVFENTLQLSVVGTVLCLALAFPMAYLITTRLHGTWKYLAIAAVVVPYWMPFLLRTYSWRILLGDNGPAASALGRSDGFGIVDSLAGAQLGVVYNYLPLAVLPIAVALDRLDPALRRAGRDLGASPWRVFWQVTLPASRIGILSAALLVFIPLMGDYVTPSVLGGVKSAVVGSLISDSFLGGQDWALGAAAAVLLIVLVALVLAVAALLVMIVRVALRTIRPLDRTARLRRGLDRAPSARWSSIDSWGVALRVFGAAVVVFLWAPILTVAAYSFNAGSTLTVWDGFSARWYAEVAHNDQLVSSIQVSLRVALLSTIVAVVIGTLAGVALTRAGRPVRWSLTGLLLVVFITPEIVTAIGLLLLFVAGGPILSDGTLRLVIGHSVISVAIVAFVVQARLSGMDPRLSDAAADLGATPMRAFRQVTLPLALPAVVAAAVLASTTSLDDVVSSSMLGNVGTTTLPVFIYSSLRNGLSGDAAAAAVVVMLVTVLAVALLGWLLARRGQAASFAAGLTGQG